MKKLAYIFIGDLILKKCYQYLGLVIIMLFSFYYTDKIAMIVLNKNPLMKTINEVKDDYEVTSVNAIIDGDYIIPGINGLTVNTKDTYYNMQKLDTFNKYYLIYDEVKPLVSLEDNKDKVIRIGNAKLKKVSIIFDEKSNLSDYFKNQGIKANMLITLDNYQKESFFELINNDYANFKTLESSLNLNKENKKICLLNKKNKGICLKNKNYLVEPTITLKENNYLEVKNNLQNGVIILISNKGKLSDLKLLIKEIHYKGLQIVPLSELISEKYS